ncbi:MAG: hypothetical protein IKE70_01385 [Bacilli bacterium]|nr:hypothetical protein [Bacilli bacterium]
MLKKEKESELENLVKQNKKKEKIKKEKVNKKWIFTVLITAFCLSFSLSFLSEMTIPNFPLWIGIIITLLFVFLGILFDIIGVAVTTADEKVFHSMNSRKVKGAKTAVKFKKNADKVSSFCCDVIGDVCGIISGAATTTISLGLINNLKWNPLITSLVVASTIASLTIGGKALGKSFAINKSDIILYEFAKFIENFYK